MTQPTVSTVTMTLGGAGPHYRYEWHMIGVTNTNYSSLGAWKRDILFFDQIFVADARSAIGVWRNSPYGDREADPLKADELEYLLTSSFFTSRDESVEHLIRASGDTDMVKKFEPYLDGMEAMRSRYNPLLDGFKDWDDLAHRMANPDVRASTRAHSALMLQLEAAFQQHQGIDATLHGSPEWARREDGANSPGHVIELALNNVPVPDETVPWEEVFAIKADPEIVHRARKLHLWAHEIAKPGMTTSRLNQYIQDSVSDYESYMKANHIRFQSSILKTAVVGTAELLEDILHLRTGKLAARLFSVQEKRADFTLAEARAPGRQLSLISTLKGRLRKLS